MMDIQEVYGILFLKVLMLVVFTLLTARIDEQHIKKGEFIYNKSPRFMQRFVFVVTISLSHFNVLWSFGGFALLFWVLFNPLLNHLRNLPFWYIGDKGLDAILKKSPLLHKFLFFMALVFGIFCLYKSAIL